MADGGERAVLRSTLAHFGMAGDWLDMVLVPSERDARRLVGHLRQSAGIPQYATLAFPTVDPEHFVPGMHALRADGSHVIIVHGADPVERDVEGLALMVRAGFLPVVAGFDEATRARTLEALPPGLVALDACRSPPAWVMTGPPARPGGYPSSSPAPSPVTGPPQ